MTKQECERKLVSLAKQMADTVKEYDASVTESVIGYYNGNTEMVVGHFKTYGKEGMEKTGFSHFFDESFIRDDKRDAWIELEA